MVNQVEDTFAFIIHPINPAKDVARKWPWLKPFIWPGLVDLLSVYFPPVYISEISGVRSMASGNEARGWFIACPFTPTRMMTLPVNQVYDKIIACGRMAEQLGARVMGLGAYTSVVGDGGVTIAEALDIPVTTGDSYTVEMAVRAVREAAEAMGIQMSGARAAVVGATGTIGSVCAEILADEVGELILVGRRPGALDAVRERCEGSLAQLRTSTAIDSIYQADLVLTVTSAVTTVIEPEHLRPGAVVCDVARPRDVSKRVGAQRDDVLVIEGGMVEVPGPVDFHFDFGFPPRMAYACMAETMILALEGRYENYSLGKTITKSQANEMSRLAEGHGFRLGHFRSFERGPVTADHIARVRERAAVRRRRPSLSHT